MRYLVTQPGHEPFYTGVFDYENHFVKGMIIYDLLYEGYTVDGINWKLIERDTL